ncbi:MAG TPA: TlpA family protein disulfide reductase [Campylobacterales bacterium]|nr:TlpA family protein disulfide reductase [Campylobacterales bacterium]
METNLIKQKQKNTQYKPLIISIIMLIIIGIYFLSQSKSTPPLSTNQNFIFKTIQSKQFHIKATKNHFNIEELKGKIVFLKVFGWNCKYCQKEIPELIKLKNKFKTAFDTVAIELQHHSDTQNLDFIKKYNINYNIINGDKQKKFLEYLKQEYKWNGVIPLTIVIDYTGKILAFEVGYKSYSLTTLLQTTLKELTSVALPTKEGEDKK